MDLHVPSLGSIRCTSARYGILVLALLAVANSQSALAQDDLDPAAAVGETQALAQAAQNPVADMISLPLQNNTLFGVGANGDTANVLNLQPVIPISLGDWNLITRTIIPLIYLPDVTAGLPEVPANVESGGNFGLGDINLTGFLSPAKSKGVVWGIGPSFGLNTATSDLLGTGKWTVGPSAVVLAMPKPWVLGVLARNLWSFAGQSDRRSVNSFLLQPFVNYNLSSGWYLVTSPLVTSNWQAGSGERWTLPLGGGAGKIFRIGSQAMNGQVQAFGNVVKPTFAPDWSLRLQLQFMFPR